MRQKTHQDPQPNTAYTDASHSDTTYSDTTYSDSAFSNTSDSYTTYSHAYRKPKAGPCSPTTARAACC